MNSSRTTSLNSSFSHPMLEKVSDFLLSDFSSPTPDDLVRPTNEWTDQLNETVSKFALELIGKNKPEPWEYVAKPLIPACRKRQYEVQVLVNNEEKKVRYSNNLKGQQILPEPEPEKEKRSERKGLWSENEKGLFLSGLHKYRWGKWKNISSHIGTRSTEQVRSYARRMQLKWSSKQHIQILPPETNRPIANPGHLPFPWTVMEPMAWASNAPPPILRPENGLDDIYGDFGGSVCYPSWNLRAEVGANPSSRISDQLWNSTNTLWSDSYGCLPGPSAYGNNMNPGQ